MMGVMVSREDLQHNVDSKRRWEGVWYSSYSIVLSVEGMKEIYKQI
jgi:hypothetical protein